MHGSVGLEVFLNVDIVLIKNEIALQIIVAAEDLLKISAPTVLLVIEAINVRAKHNELLLGKELKDNTPIL